MFVQDPDIQNNHQFSSANHIAAVMREQCGGAQVQLHGDIEQGIQGGSGIGGEAQYSHLSVHAGIRCFFDCSPTPPISNHQII